VGEGEWPRQPIGSGWSAHTPPHVLSESVKRVRRAEFPDFCWDQLPIGGPEASLLRLDYLFPVPKEATAIEPYEYRLSPPALAILDDWLAWLTTGELGEECELGIIREGLPEA
jgi:hypothetical protein